MVIEGALNACCVQQRLRCAVRMIQNYRHVRRELDSGQVDQATATSAHRPTYDVLMGLLRCLENDSLTFSASTDV